jgi:glycosyltransferase involved in cell wall biosynthesis
MEVFFDGTFLKNRTGIGRDARVLLEVCSEIFESRIRVIYPLELFVSRGKLAAFANSLYKKLILLRMAFFSQPKRIQVPDNTTYIQPHLHSCIPVGLNINRIQRIHDVFPLSNPEWFRLVSNKVFRNNISYLDESTTLLFDSKTSLNNFNRVIDKQMNLKEMSVAYCSVPFFKPSFKCGSCDYCHRGVYESVYILAVGTIEPRKNYAFLLKSWKQYKTQNYSDNRKLIIVGKYGWKSRKVRKQLLSGEDEVIWLRQICDEGLRRLYLSMECFISVSKNEGFNLPVAESLSLGQPIILSRIPVHEELYGEQAIFVEIDKIIDFYEIIQWLENAKESNSAQLPIELSEKNTRNQLMEIINTFKEFTK